MPMPYLVFTLFLIAATPLFAQDHRGELSIGGTFTAFGGSHELGPLKQNGNYAEFDSFGFGPELKFMYRVKKRFMVGVIGGFSRGDGGRLTIYHQGNVEAQHAAIEGRQQYAGVEIQWSTIRYRGFVFYAHFDGMWASLNDKVIGFSPVTGVDGVSISKFNTSGFGGGFGIGFIVRINPYIKFNIVDINYGFFDHTLSYDGQSTNGCAVISSAIIVNLIRAK